MSHKQARMMLSRIRQFFVLLQLILLDSSLGTVQNSRRNFFNERGEYMVRFGRGNEEARGKRATPSGTNGFSGEFSHYVEQFGRMYEKGSREYRMRERIFK